MNVEKVEHNIVWLIDPVHSMIRFETKYLLITSVSGWFTKFEGTVVTPSEDFNDSQIKLTVYTNSIYTGNEERDHHLRSSDFFDAKKYPTLSFQSSFVTIKDSKVAVVGDLRIKDVTETIEIEANYVGSARDPMGNLKAGFEMSTTLNRKDFGISWNKVFDQASVLLSEEVKVFCNIQLLKLS
jgi:polyisoprenoid-binding protein YceI